MPDSKFVVEIAHSPDSDDAFMFYALAKGFVSSELVEFRHILSDIQSLNVAAQQGRYTMTAISYHAYPYVADKYILTSAGSSVGDGYGPIVVAREALDAMFDATESLVAKRPGFAVKVGIYSFSSDASTVLPMQPFDRSAIRKALEDYTEYVDAVHESLKRLPS